MSANPRSDAVHDFDRNELRRVLGLLIDPDACHEVRALPSARSRLIRGSDLDAGVAAICDLAGDNGYYITLNPVRHDLGDKAASDDDAMRRRHFLLDFDRGSAVKKRAGSDSSATEAEKDAIKAVADLVLEDLTALGWPRPIMLDSGNGWHLVYAIDLPNDETATALLKGCLAAIQASYGNEHADVDTTVCNAGRITKLPGTWVRKGPNAKDRPHRMARLVSVPTAFTAVPIEKLQQVAALMAEPEPTPPPPGDPWRVPGVASNTPRDGYARAALIAECREVAATPEGQRNNRLNLAAFRIGQLLHLGLGYDEAAGVLMHAANAVGLGQLEASKTIRSGLRGGQEHPRDPAAYPDSTPNRADGAIGTIVPIVPPYSICDEPDPWEPPHVEPAPPSPPFPLDVLPESLADLCRAGAAAVQCPVDYFAAAALGLVGGVIGRTVALKITDTYEVTPNLFMAVVGGPGSRKSPALKIMAGALYGIDRRLREQYKQDRKHFKELPDKDKDKAEEPVHYHLTLDDTTREAFGKILNDNPRGLVLVKDELTAWVADLNAYRGGKGSDRQFWMSLNTGAMVKITRKGSPEPLVIAHPCAAVVGCLTPSSLPQVRDGSSDDGWFDRILFAYPEPVERSKTWERREIPRDLIDDWSHAIDRLWARTMVRDEQTQKSRPFWVRLDEGGERQWAEFYEDHCREQDEHDFPKALRGPWSKYEGFAGRLALILSQLDQAYSLDVDTRPADVSGVHVRGAALLIAYFKAQFRRVRAELFGSDGTLDDDSFAVLDWLKEERIETFTARDLTRKFRRFNESDRRAAIETLTACKIVRFAGKARAGDRPGRPRMCYEVNPAIHEG